MGGEVKLFYFFHAEHYNENDEVMKWSDGVCEAGDDVEPTDVYNQIREELSSQNSIPLDHIRMLQFNRV